MANRISFSSIALFFVLSIASQAQPCKNLSKYYYQDTITICGRINALNGIYIQGTGDSVATLKSITYILLNIQLPISVVNKKIERNPKLDISESNIQEIEIGDTKNLISKEFQGETKRLRGIFFHSDSLHTRAKVWFDLIEIN